MTKRKFNSQQYEIRNPKEFRKALGNIGNKITNLEQSDSQNTFELDLNNDSVIEHYYKVEITDNSATKFFIPFSTGSSEFLSGFDGQKINISIYNNYSGYNEPISFHTGYLPAAYSNNEIFTFSGQITGENYQYYQDIELIYNVGTGGESTQKWEVFSYNGIKL